MNNLHLVCNAHLDPVWLWEWEEGAAEAVSTFRVAADFCEEFEGFVFNHNEVILYKWIEEYEPALFQRIQRLVKEGKWHIMGGWYLQPDCNMPSGESFVRQILTGRKYFLKKFGVKPTTAINFDPFGHSRGLVQILNKSGYDSYVFCRPGPEDCSLPADDFIWVGYDGSKIIGHRASDHYNSHLGQAVAKVERWMENNPEKNTGLVLWGIGNHGGGPSRIDLEKLTQFIEETDEFNIKHSCPEAYFEDLQQQDVNLSEHKGDINPWAVGCYTSQIRIKQKHRQLENEIYMTEKMLSTASLQGYLDYPRSEINEAIYDLLTAEFHDILPGSSIQPVEESSIRLMEHGCEIVSRLKARAFFALASGQKEAAEDEIPILVYNPHPYPVSGIFECEFQLEDQNWGDDFSLPVLYQGDKKIPCQVENEASNLNLDWRKHVVFQTELEPGQMNRFDCKIKVIEEKPEPSLEKKDGKICFDNGHIEVVINCNTGLIDQYQVDGVDYLQENSMKPLVIADDEDSWGMRVQEFTEVAGEFSLMSPESGSKFSGFKDKVLDSVRIIEDGDVRTVVEALFAYGDSQICQRYKLPKTGTEIEVEVRVYWQEKDKMLKLAVPTKVKKADYIGQVAYGKENLSVDGKEAVAQKWVAVVADKQCKALTCINDGIYGSDFNQGQLRLSLLRAPGYAAHPIKDRPIMPQDRFSPRVDQGERIFNFWFNAGELTDRMEKIDREALSYNEKPMTLSFFPPGGDTVAKPVVKLSDEVVQLTAFKKAETSDNYIIRLFEPTGQERETVVKLPYFDLEKRIKLAPFTIVTLKLTRDGKLKKTDLIEGK